MAANMKFFAGGLVDKAQIGDVLEVLFKAGVERLDLAPLWDAHHQPLIPSKKTKAVGSEQKLLNGPSLEATAVPEVKARKKPSMSPSAGPSTRDLIEKKFRMAQGKPVSFVALCKFVKAKRDVSNAAVYFILNQMRNNGEALRDNQKNWVLLGGSNPKSSGMAQKAARTKAKVPAKTTPPVVAHLGDGIKAVTKAFVKAGTENPLSRADIREILIKIGQKPSSVSSALKNLIAKHVIVSTGERDRYIISPDYNKTEQPHEEMQTEGASA